MRAVNTCENCSTQLQEGQKFCNVCGMLIVADEYKILGVECEMHPNHQAIGLCVICGKPVCSDCEVKTDNKILCNNPEHKILFQEWSVLYQPDSEFEAEPLLRNLADGGIEIKTFSLHDHITTYWLNENRILLFIRKSEIERVKALLKGLNLIDNN